MHHARTMAVNFMSKYMNRGFKFVVVVESSGRKHPLRPSSVGSLHLFVCEKAIFLYTLLNSYIQLRMSDAKKKARAYLYVGHAAVKMSS